MIRALPAYLLAALLGVAGAAGTLSAVAARTVPMLGTAVPLAYLLPPLVGLALFQLAFGLTAGRWRGWRFWAAALPLSVAIWGGCLIALLQGAATWRQAAVAAALGHVLAGLAALATDRRVRR